MLTREHGKVLWEATFDIGTVAGMAAAFAPLVAESMVSRSIPTGGGRHTLVERVPHGVVGAIIPFNWPASVMGNKVLPALLAGNAVVVKAPPTCPGADARSVRLYSPPACRPVFSTWSMAPTSRSAKPS